MRCQLVVFAVLFRLAAVLVEVRSDSTSAVDKLSPFGSSSDLSTGDVEKRRGWGKRSSMGDDIDELERRNAADEEIEALVDSRRRLQRISEKLDEDLEGGESEERLLSAIDKRRGWGKRFSAASSAAGIRGAAAERKRGWGKRSDAADNEPGFESLFKRRGWGKRSRDFDELDDGPDKRRGWGKRLSDSDRCLHVKDETNYFLCRAIEVST